jgi:hypothetical protein
MADKIRPKAATPVRATRHADTRPNIPTAELESFARPEENRRTVSRPFPRPATSKVAVKVINHYGDEVMKVAGAA